MTIDEATGDIENDSEEDEWEKEDESEDEDGENETTITEANKPVLRKQIVSDEELLMEDIPPPKTLTNSHNECFCNTTSQNS